MTVTRLERTLGHTFADRQLLEQALTHRSHGTPHNERLEFVGDSVLNCVIALELFRRFPSLNEGEMSRLRANLVCQETLYEIADFLAIGDCLNLGEGELKSGGRKRPSMLADALEAIIGAVHLDAGFASAQGVVQRLYESRLSAIIPGQQIKDPKTRLQEVLQGRRLELPRYSLLDTAGESHAQSFRVCCEITALRLRAEGVGTSRRAAEQKAAEAILESLK